MTTSIRARLAAALIGAAFAATSQVTIAQTAPPPATAAVAAQQGGSSAPPRAAAAADVTGVSTYRLAAGDVISVRVFNEPEFTQERVRLTDAGTVSFPILGELPVLGRTVGDLEALITERLKGRILVNPQVTVWIEQYRPFFINGMVERPGAYPFLPGLTVRKAASIAGGFRERASMNKIFLQREQDPARNKPRLTNLDAEIGPGDTITVEESFF
jgi:protein involved in polysaccharide export with SLBB domain